MQLENIEKIEENLENEDEHIINMWTPLDIEIDEDYDYIKEGIMFKIASTLLYIIVWPILVVYNKIMYNFKIYGRKNLTKIKTGKITVSNHVHPMDCTMNAIAKNYDNLFGGSADLAHSNMTYLNDQGDFRKDTPEGKNIWFGVREFGMSSAGN